MGVWEYMCLLLVCQFKTIPKHACHLLSLKELTINLSYVPTSNEQHFLYKSLYLSSTSNEQTLFQPFAIHHKMNHYLPGIYVSYTTHCSQCRHFIYPMHSDAWPNWMQIIQEGGRVIIIVKRPVQLNILQYSAAKMEYYRKEWWIPCKSRKDGPHIFATKMNS